MLILIKNKWLIDIYELKIIKKILHFRIVKSFCKSLSTRHNKKIHQYLNFTEQKLKESS
jgi:hypothetical protein